MGYTFGVIVFKRELEQEEKTLLSMIVSKQSVKTKMRLSANQVFDSTFGDIAIGHIKNHTLLVNPDIPHEFTRDFDFVPVSAVHKFLENLSEKMDILCVHIQSTSGVIGHALFSKGKRCEAVYKSEDEWETIFDCQTDKIIREKYNADYLFKRLNQFVEDDFYHWMNNESLTFVTYK